MHYKDNQCQCWTKDGCVFVDAYDNYYAKPNELVQISDSWPDGDNLFYDNWVDFERVGAEKGYHPDDDFEKIEELIAEDLEDKDFSDSEIEEIKTEVEEVKEEVKEEVEKVEEKAEENK